MHISGNMNLITELVVAGGSSKQIGSLDFGHLDFAGFKHFSEPGLLVIHSNCQYVSVSYSWKVYSTCISFYGTMTSLTRLFFHLL